MESLSPLLGHTLILVAHPDDEALGCGALLQRMRQPIVVFATDGAPRSDFFWKKFGSRADYAALRRTEAMQALALAGVKNICFLAESAGSFCDQELFLNLKAAVDALGAVVERESPEALLTLAYEGGHPDHDACNFITSVIASRFSLPAWEMPLYHRSVDGSPVHQRFVRESGAEQFLHATEKEAQVKRAMFQAYKSQFESLPSFRLNEERYRRLPANDYARPPHDGRLNYEVWGWPMTGSQVCEAFTNFLRAANPKHNPGRTSEPGPNQPQGQSA
jgi:LmbE family N-acetylglucosaminyl deacetylase